MRPDSEVRRLHADRHGRILEVADHWIERMAPESLEATLRRQWAALAVAVVIRVQQQRISPELIDSCEELVADANRSVGTDSRRRRMIVIAPQ